MTRVHHFVENRAYERSQAPLLTALWSAWWPGSTRLPSPTLDYDAVLRGPSCLGDLSVEAEEKIRRQDWPDVLLELRHSDGAPGWSTKGSKARLLLYAWEPSRTGYVFPMASVQRVARLEGDRWLRAYGARVARNPGYSSTNVPVPIAVFTRAVDKAHGPVRCPGCGGRCHWSAMRGPTSCADCRGGSMKLVAP